MSMRIYTPQDFKAALLKFGFVPSGETKNGFSIWKNANGDAFTVPEQKYYPDYVLDNLLSHLNEDGLNTAPEAHQKSYRVTD